MTSSTTAYLTIDAGGTYFKSAVLNEEGDILPGSYNTVQSFSDGTKEKILGAFQQAVLFGVNYIQNNKAVFGGIAVATPGPFNIYTAQPLMQHKFNAIYGMNLREYFYSLPGVPAKLPIEFYHDANAVLKGEMWKGNAKGFGNIAVITLGTGLGLAVSVNGEIQCNEIGGPAISIFGRTYGNGILEDYTAKRGFLRIYQEISGKKDITKTEVADLGKWADNGEPFCLQTFQKVGKILAREVKDILIENEVECLLFAGQISRSFHHMERTVVSELKDISSLGTVTIVKSLENSALTGTLKNLLNKVV